MTQLSQTPTSAEAVEELLVLDGYLTDGQRLFRVVSDIAGDEPDGIVSLEDCRSLQARVYSCEELAAMGLSRVRPAAAR